MENKKITQDSVINAIQQLSDIIVKKHELYENIKVINGEIKTLYESAPPMVGSFGFKLQNDSAPNVSGFETNPNISYIAQLEKEMGDENKEKAINEVEMLQMENEKLKQELAELRSKA